MAIQMRRGAYTKFAPSKLLPGEWAVVQQDDSSVRDGRAAYMCFAPGIVKRMATYEDMIDNMADAVEDARRQTLVACTIDPSDGCLYAVYSDGQQGVKFKLSGADLQLVLTV